MKWLTVPVALVLLTCHIGSAQTVSGKAGDPRVRAALDGLDVSYEIDSDGDFKVTFEFEEDGRSQIAFVNSGTESFNQLEIREVWSPAYRSAARLNAEVANRLLEDSYLKKLGAWQTVNTDDGKVAVFAAKIAADADADSLWACLQLVLVAADEMEKELLGTDEF